MKTFAVFNWILNKVFPHNMASAEALASVARPQQHLMGGDFVLDPVRLQSYKFKTISEFSIFSLVLNVVELCPRPVE